MAHTREQRAEWAKNRYIKIMKFSYDFLGGKCVKCGSVENLDIDHINPSEKSFEITSNVCRSIKKIHDELKKCQLLCRNCHSYKTIVDCNRKVAKGTHGTLSAYRYCKCDLCKAAMREYNAKYQKIKSQ